MHLARFPRVSLGHFPTPLEPLNNLSKLLGGPQIWIKRDDATGLASGGNKTRKLEFLLADALEKNADVIITNKVVVDASMIEQCQNLKLILISATGTNNVDLFALRRKAI